MQKPSAQDALTKARANIEAAKKAQGSKQSIIKHYRAAKKALDSVDVMKADSSTHKEIVVAFEDLAMTLEDHSEEQIQEKTVKCRQRANDVRQKLEGRMKIYAATIAPSLVGPGFSSTITQAGVAHWNSLLSSNSTTSTATFVAKTIDIPSTSRLPLLPSSQAVISPSAANAIPASGLFFCKDVIPEPCICPLPGPNEQLQTTHQLAYCLALLQPSVQEDDLSLEALTWRHSTSINWSERVRLETLSVEIIQTFAKETMKEADAVVEVVQLAPVLNSDHSRFLLKTFIDAIDESEMLHLHALEGLALAIQGADPVSIDSNDLVTILRILHKRLRSSHSASHQYPLLLAISRVLDAMADAQIGDIDRINLHGPLADLLRESESSESESSQNPYMTFQAAYATQALLNVSDDDNIWRAGFRRLWTILKGGAGFAKMPDLTETKEALEGLEKLYEASKGGVRLLKDALEAVKGGESPTFTVKEGLKFKRAWYRALRTAESYIQTGRLVLFKDLISTVSCRHQLMFQWGICQLLGRFATDPQWDLDARQDAVTFLGELYRDSGLWNLKKEVDRVIFDMLTNIVSKNDKLSKAARLLLDEMEKHNMTLKSISNLQSPPWNYNRPSEPDGHATPNSTVLKAVQDKSRQLAKLENLPNLPTPPNLDDIRSALKTYHEPDLFILRVSGQELDLETCFVNLAIVEAQDYRQKKKQDLKEQAAAFHRIPSFETVQNTNTQALIPLEQLFNKRLRDGRELAPKKILVQGRAGIGKTTLCKKLVYAHQNGMWRDLFDVVLWLPLRHLWGSKSRTLEGLFREKVFIAQDLDQEQKELAHSLAVEAQKGKVLFVLDGLDEIVTYTGNSESRDFRSFLKTLLSQQYVVITSRPSGLDSKLLPPIDLELETVGFSQQNVDDFLVMVLEPEAVPTVRDFIRQTPLIQGLVNIPVQLDVICFSWDSLPRDGMAITMTGLYQLMVRKLWCKDAIRLKKMAGGKDLTEKQIGQLSPVDIDELMAIELQHLGYLAFKGMSNNFQIEFDERDLLSAFGDLKGQVTDRDRFLPPQVVEVMKQTSFLHTADADLNHANDSRQAWHFLHLTFQEYFAATWIVRHFHFHPQQTCFSTGMMTMEKVTTFVHHHKYNPRYEIVWSMVAGMMEGAPLHDFFGLLQGAPRDLIGGRHQRILASCFKEARNRLDPALVVTLSSQLMKWLHFEMQVCQQGNSHISIHIPGSLHSFPEDLLAEALNSECPQKIAFINALGARSALSDSTIQSIIAVIEEEDWSSRFSVARALGNRSTLPEYVIQALVAALKDEDKNVASSAAWALGKQSTLPQSASLSLVDALKDEINGVRSWASSALREQSFLPESTIQSLIVTLQDVDKRVRISAASALGYCSVSGILRPTIQPLTSRVTKEGVPIIFSPETVLASRSELPESAIQSLVAALEDDDEGVRHSAALALGDQPTLPESAALPLVDALKDKNEDVRLSAALALRKLSSMSECVVRSLVAVLEDKDGSVRSKAALALSYQSALPESAIQPFIVALKDEYEGRLFSSGEQSTFPESTIQRLVAALKGENEEVRSAAASVLRRQPTLRDSTIQSLVDALKDEAENVRRSAASALGSQSMLPESAAQSLVLLLKSEDKDVRSSAVSALHKLSTMPEYVVQSLVTALKDEDENIRHSAASALSMQSTLPESAIQSLINALKDEYEPVRCSAASALGSQSMLPESAAQSLVLLLKSEDKDVRSSAISVLRKLSTMPEYVVQSLVTALKDEDDIIRHSAASALSMQSTLPESAIQSLINALKDEYEPVRCSAASALGGQSMLPESAAQSLVLLLTDKDISGRSSAISALRYLSTMPESVAQSLVAALKDGDKNIRYSAASALGMQSTLSESATLSLVDALKDEYEYVRSSAASAFGKQPSLQESVIRPLVAAIKDESQSVTSSVLATLQKQYRSLCFSLPHLTEDEIARLYENHLFQYSCSHVMSLQIQDGGLLFYTEQGELRVEPISNDKAEIISSAFRTIQHKAGLES